MSFLGASGSGALVGGTIWRMALICIPGEWVDNLAAICISSPPWVPSGAPRRND